MPATTASAKKTLTSLRTLAAPSVPATTATAAIETTTFLAVVAVVAGVVPTAVVGVVVVAARGAAVARISMGDCPEASTSNAACRRSASRRLYKDRYVSVEGSPDSWGGGRGAGGSSSTLGREERVGNIYACLLLARDLSSGNRGLILSWKDLVDITLGLEFGFQGLY